MQQFLLERHTLHAPKGNRQPLLLHNTTPHDKLLSLDLEGEPPPPQPSNGKQPETHNTDQANKDQHRGKSSDHETDKKEELNEADRSQRSEC
jgi:hypothetical protein